jgi:hypothetical protein
MMEGPLKVTPVGTIRDIRSLNEVYRRRRSFYRHLKEAVQKENTQRSLKTGRVKSTLYVQSVHDKPISNSPAFRVSISQAARNRMTNSDVIDLVPTIAPDQTVVFKPLPYSA